MDFKLALFLLLVLFLIKSEHEVGCLGGLRI